MEKILLLPALAILTTCGVFGAPGGGYDNIDSDDVGASQCFGSLEEPGYCRNGGDAGSEGPVGFPARIFTVPDGWKPPSNEPCPDPIQVKQNFNLTRYLGFWYEVQRMWNPFSTEDCVTAQYTLREDGNIEVINSVDLNSSPPGIGVPSDGGEGRLTVSFPTSGRFPQPAGPNYNILLTDYKSYSVVYTCDTLQIPQSPLKFKLEYSWILSRTPYISEFRVEEIKDNLRRFLNIDTERYNQTGQENCPRLKLEKND